MTRSAGAASRVGRTLRWLARALGVLLALLLMCLVLALTLLNTGWGKEQLARRVNLALSETFKGSVEIREIGSLGLSGVKNVDGIVKDEAGQVVLDVQNLDVDVDLLGTLWELVAGASQVTSIHIEGLRVDNARVRLLDAGEGVPSLAEAFEARAPSPPSPTSTELFIEDIGLRHVWVHGNLAGAPIDAEFDELQGQLRVASSLVIVVDDAEIELRALPLELDPQGSLEARLELPLDSVDAKQDEKRHVTASFRGRAWSSEVSAHARLEGNALSARLLAPAIEPQRLEVLLPQSDLKRPVALSARISGTLEKPQLALRLGVEDGTVQVDASADLERRTAQIQTKVGELELSALDPALPEGSLSLSADLSLSAPGSGALRGQYQLHLPDQMLGDLPLPETTVRGSFGLEPQGGWTTHGVARIQEPGAATTLDYRVLAPDGSPIVMLEASTELETPARLARALPALSLTGKLETKARLDAERRSVKASVNGRLRRAAGSDWSVQDLEFHAEAQGALDAPRLQLDARFASARFRGRTLRSGELHAAGTPGRLRVRASADEPRRLDLRADVVLQPELRVVNPEIDIQGEDVAGMRVSGGGVEISGNAVVVRDVTIEGPDGGLIRVSLSYRDSLRKLELDAKDFDVRRALELLGLGVNLPSGTLNARVSYEDRRGAPDGFLRATLRNIGYGPVEGAFASVEAELASGKLAAEFAAAWRDSRIEILLDDVRTTQLARGEWQQTSGRVRARAHLELERLEPLYRLPGVPLDSAAGTVNLELHLAHPEDGSARLSTELQTRGLSLVGRSNPTAHDSSPDNQISQAESSSDVWSISDLDVDLGLSASEADRQLSLHALISDERGKLVQTQVDASLPRTVAGRHLVEWPQLWRQAELRALMWVLPRRLSEWPQLGRLPGIDGVASTTLEVTGNYGSLSARVMGRIENFGASEQRGAPLDLAFSGRYTPRGGELNLGATLREKRVATFESVWRGDALTSLFPERSGNAPDLTLRAAFDGLPTASLPGLGSKHVRGHLSGKVEVESLSDPMQAELDLSSRDLSVQDIDFEKVQLTAAIAGDRVRSHFELSGRELGRLQASVAGQAKIADGDFAGLEAQLRARSFELGALGPFVSSYISSLSGKLDARLAGRLSSDQPDLRGTIVVRDGTAQLPSLGQTLHDIDARVQVEPGRVRLSQLNAKGLTGELTATGSAKLDGLQLQTAEAKLLIDEDEKLPVTVQGVNLGDAWGNLAVSYRALGERRQRLEVDVNDLNLVLPEVAPHSVQSLEPAQHIEVGFRRPDGSFDAIPLQPVRREDEGPPTRWLIAINLGSVTIYKGAGIEIELGGKLQARVGRRTRLTGRIDLEGGTLDVSGKEFVIESGSVTFNGTEPEQGIVVATARWDSPLEYTVYAEYRGTVQQGDLELRSEPPLTEDEVLSLIMFGTPEGSFGAGAGSNEAATAVGVAGGTVARGLNRALADISNLDVSTRVDTSTGEARPELVVQLTPRITARVTQAIGEPPPGQSPDRTFFTVDFRVFRRWSLSAQVGDEGGSTFDMIWRHRY